MNKKLICFLALCSLSLGISACSKTTDSTISNKVDDSKLEAIGKIDTYINLGENISIKGSGVEAEGSVVTINSAGTYSVSGSLKDGQLVVNASDKDDVYIVLDNADIACSNSSAVNIISADKVVLYTQKDSSNNLSDGESYQLEENTDEPNATVFSKADLVITGEGSLDIKGNYNNAVTSKDDLRIQGGSITVEAKNHGMKGKDCVDIVGGNIKITAQGDGIKSTNIEDATRGYVKIAGGSIDITAGEDGIQAETDLVIDDGNIKISSGGGSQNSSQKEGWGDWKREIPNDKRTPMEAETIAYTSSDEETEQSAKAIKSTKNIEINGGKIEIDSSDDAIHSNDSIKITAGSINIASGDDGIHSDSTLSIEGGDINIEKAYEGLESSQIDISDGKINLTASDDGINVSGGNDGSSLDRKGANGFEDVTDGSLNINGGTILVNADGDGLDSNGSVEINDGLVVVNGPTNDGNGSLDYGKEFNVNGGTLIAVGSSGMMQNPSESSSQNTISAAFTAQSQNTLVHIESEDGDDILTFEPAKQYSSIIFSSNDIEDNKTYKVYVGGEHTGKSENGIYSDGEYNNGEEVGSIEITAAINSINQAGGFGNRMDGGMKPGREDMMPNMPKQR